jgi:hypothetical protein
VEGVVTIGGEIGSEREEKEKYDARQIEISEKLILVINYLSDKLKAIQPIVLEIEELKDLDSAVQLLKRQDLDIADPSKLERVKKQLKSKGVKERMEKRSFEPNTWVLISGPVSVTSLENAYYVVFDYISGEKEAVQFSCQVPSNDGHFSDMSQGQGAPLKLNVFGIVNRAVAAEETGRIDFQINCVGIYR